MRKFNFRNIYFCFLIISFILCGILCVNKNNNVFAEGENTLLTITQYTSSDESSGTRIGNGEVAFVTASQKVVVSFKIDNDPSLHDKYSIIQFTYSATLNGKSISSIQDSYNINVETFTTSEFKMVSLFNGIKTSPYGKYSLTFNYFLKDNNDNQSTYSTSMTFYCVPQSNYYEATHASSVFENCNAITAQNLTATYDRIYLYNYTYENILSSQKTNNLPSVTFNKYSIKATIKKTFQKTSETQIIYFNGTNIIAGENSLVEIIAPTDSDNITLVFNDIGSYSITYDFIYINNNTFEEIPASTNATQNKMFANVKRCDLIEVFGYQLYYNDVTTSKMQEFKTLKDGKITDGTDFSYLVTNYDESLNVNTADSSYINNQSTRLATLLNLLNNNEINIQKTNQSPVQFKYNVAIYNKSNVSAGAEAIKNNDKINSVQSKYWKLTNNGTAYTESESYDYDNKPFTETGIYLVNVVYKFTPMILGSDSACQSSVVEDTTSGSKTYAKLRSQWFLFEITNETIEMQVETSDNQALYDGSFTNKEVHVNKSKDLDYSKYNAQTKLVLSFQENYTGAYKILESDSNGNYTVNKNGNYIATMYFGKELKRNYSSTFTIDTDEIEDIQTFEVFKNNNSTSYTYKNEFGNINTFDFLTSKNAIVSWNNKLSGSVITAKYKYIPLGKNTTTLSSFTLKQYYANSMSIPNEYSFQENATKNLSEINYNNAKNYIGTNIESSFVLTQSGMYVFELKDSAGNTSYFGFVIDKTPNLVIQELDDVYSVEHSTQNILSSDAKVLWGKYKAIQFTDLKYSSGNYQTQDAWVNNVIENLSDKVKNTYLTSMQINGIASYYIISENESNALMYVNEQKTIISSSTEYAYQVEFANGENTYEFYFLSKQDSKYLSSFANSETFFLNNYVATHKLKISSDASRMSLYYGQIGYDSNNNITNNFLGDSSYKPASTTNGEGFSKISNYLTPTSEKMIAENPIISLVFDATPEEGVIEIESVKYSFSPFSKNTTRYTYEFNGVLDSDVVVYDRNQSASANLAKIGTNGLYVWEVNKEYNYLLNNYSGGYQTVAGKYTITRTYKILTETVDRVNESFDYIERAYTFIVDPYGIITAPEYINGALHSYIGDSIKLQVLEGVDQMFFNDVFVASNNPSEVIMSTNKLPVSVLIPSAKYGYSIPTFIKESSIMYYNPGDMQSEITSYALTAEIKYKEKSASSTTASKIYYSLPTAMTNGYLGFYTDSNGTIQNSFQAVGFYEVSIYQGIGANRSSFTFCFEIVEDAPKFSITTLSNDELGQNNNCYYTNQETIRISWQDPENEYLAVIDVNKIKCNINGTITYLNPADINTSGVNHYIDVDINALNGYYNNSVIEITMQYQGDSKFYNAGSYSASKTVIIDTVAPQTNINNLVLTSGITPELVRNVQTKYNTSVTSGLYSYFAYVVDASKFTTLIDTRSYADGQAKDIYFKEFAAGTKYNSIYVQETPTSVIENSLASFSSIDTLIDNIKLYSNRYIEIVELDLAGNITIYTIYLTDIYDETQITNNVIEYKNNDKTNSFKYENLEGVNEIFAKSSLEITNINFSNYAWGQFTVGNVTYLKTPYLANGYYNLNTYDPNNKQASVVSLKDFATFNSNSTKYSISLNFVPYFNKITIQASVLNASLSAILTSKTEQYGKEEGVLIKIPNSISAKDATIYAVSVKITRFEKLVGTNTYKEEQIYEFADETYFSVINKDITGPSTISLSYVTYLGGTYLKIILTNPAANTYYKYRIVDNFDEVFTDINIYDSEKIEKELSSSVDIQNSYEHGDLYQYSTKDIEFRYNDKKDKIRLTIVSTYETLVYNLWEASEKESFMASSYGTINEPINSVIKIIKLKAPTLDMSSGLVGGEYRYFIEKFEAFNNIDSMSSPYQKLNLIIYNIVPSFVLYGTLNESENALFNKGTMYGNQINITYKQSTGNIPCEVYLESPDGKIETFESGKIVSEPGTYNIIVKFTKILTDKQYNVVLDFTISNNESDFYNVVYTKDGQTYYATPTGTPFTYKASDKTRSVPTHYILGTNDFNIIYNTEQGVTEEKEPEIITISGYITYIYQLTNVSNASSNITTFYNRTIAITIIPTSTNILANYSYYTNEGTRSNLSGTLATFVISKEENYTTSKKLAWQSYYGITENRVKVSMTYGDNNAEYTPNIITENNISYITLTTSGTYYLTFSDIAGNIHLFDGSTSTYTIRYIKSVIYTVNGESPVNNAIYDGEVEISIPKSTTKYYDTNAQPSINVLRNGVEYEVEKDSYNRTFRFTEPGLYKVSFSAAVTNISTKITTAINEEPLYFLIIKSTESRYAFDYSEYSTYYIKSIVKNDIDVTKEYTNSNMGNIIYVSDINDVANQKPYLKNILISVNDAKTGRGKYTLTVCTNNEFNQEFSFSFWINSPEPPIQVSLKENEATTDKIYVTFNTLDLIENVGDCVLKISGRKEIKLNNELLNDNKLQESYNIELSDARVYDIQLFSESGKLLYTYRVTRNEPLNSMSIILIVVSSIVLVAGVVVFVLLRKRMKIR